APGQRPEPPTDHPTASAIGWRPLAILPQDRPALRSTVSPRCDPWFRPTPPPLPCGRPLRDHPAPRATASRRTHLSKPGAFAPPPAAAAVNPSLAGVGSARIWFWSLSASHACTLVIFQRAARVQPRDDFADLERGAPVVSI